MKQGNVKTLVGEVHWRSWSGEMRDTGAASLVCLHPLPHDGLFFEAMVPFLTVERRVLAPDYPGYGSSQALGEEPTVELYARAMIETIRAQGASGSVDLLGFHTGCLVAVEMALRYPDEVRRLVLVDVPYFTKGKRQELLAGETVKGGFRAAFSYPNEQRFPLVKHASLVLATASSLLEPSRRAARSLPVCTLQEFPDVTAPALVNGAAVLSATTLEFLDHE